MKVGVITFPGSNCDWDIFLIMRDFFRVPIQMLSYRESLQKNYDLLILPGGFSYGDYLRAGAIARFAPIMKNLQQHVKRGAAVLGICNGFQILCEAGLLPGALIRNLGLKHICRTVELKANPNNRFTASLSARRTYKIPISHSEGNYYIPTESYKAMQDRGQITFTYSDNPNGSIGDIAGVTDTTMRILGMMPHPERAVDPLSGSANNASNPSLDGKIVLESILNAI